MVFLYIFIIVILILVFYSDLNFDDIISLLNRSVENTPLDDIQELDESQVNKEGIAENKVVKKESEWRIFLYYILMFLMLFGGLYAIYYSYINLFPSSDIVNAQSYVPMPEQEPQTLEEALARERSFAESRIKHPEKYTFEQREKMINEYHEFCAHRRLITNRDYEGE